MAVDNKTLSALLNSKKIGRSKTQFSNLLVAYLGAPVKEHFPNEKNPDGSTKKDAQGNSIKSTVSDGFSCNYSELGTSRKIMVVTKQKPNPALMENYFVSGAGYDLRDSNLAVIDENSQIQLVEMKG